MSSFRRRESQEQRQCHMVPHRVGLPLFYQFFVSSSYFDDWLHVDFLFSFDWVMGWWWFIYLLSSSRFVPFWF
jgi:hypothetical protein